MIRKFIDCRDFPSEMQCTVAIFADTQEELLEAAVQHAILAHGYQDSQELREKLKKAFKNERRRAA